MKKQDRQILDWMHRHSEPEAEGMVCPNCGEYMENTDVFEWVCPECDTFFSEDIYMDSD